MGGRDCLNVHEGLSQVKQRTPEAKQTLVL